ncbi:hypothetical protein, partial [Mesorhizobium sp.]|uniref:hypothetical protein n=1 Tax=Mesorhizobium sp. TaxID=1871066 RepID=UPI0025F469F5
MNREEDILLAFPDMIMEVSGSTPWRNTTSEPTNLIQEALCPKWPNVMPGRGNTTGRLPSQIGQE